MRKIRKHMGVLFVLFEAMMHTYLVIYLIIRGANIPLILFTTFELSMFLYLVIENRKKINPEREALQHVLNVLGPLDSEHTRSVISCDGCLYDWQEALLTVENVLNGKEVDDHYAI